MSLPAVASPNIFISLVPPLFALAPSPLPPLALRFYYQAKVEGVRYEPMLVATSTVGSLVVGLLGITYSLFSADWDGGESRGLGGVETFNENLGRVKEGVGRGRANTKKRDLIDQVRGTVVRAVGKRGVGRLVDIWGKALLENDAKRCR